MNIQYLSLHLNAACDSGCLSVEDSDDSSDNQDCSQHEHKSGHKIYGAYSFTLEEVPFLRILLLSQQLASGEGRYRADHHPLYSYIS